MVTKKIMLSCVVLLLSSTVRCESPFQMLATKGTQIAGTLDTGAAMLVAAPDQFQNQAVRTLEDQLLGGISNDLMNVLFVKAGDIANKRSEIEAFKKIIVDNRSLAENLGFKPLVNDLLEGFAAADQALAMLWDSGDITKLLAPSTVTATDSKFRKKFKQAEQQAQISAVDKEKILLSMKNSGILWELLYASEGATRQIKDAVYQLKDQIMILRDKVGGNKQGDLAVRMRALAFWLRGLQVFGGQG
jgi:hypothetical protein